ncbi:MAG: BlaI/MecI/CopY family transcriptional regulator [Candidatus Aenigmarchaeota archaeon]|nr:BlaI/MecI/CopY family transcriptional regulator [Candidatus Aenigmarchaeota archaeon]
MVKVEKIRFNKKGMNSLLSPLESETLDLLWKKDQAKVKDLHNILKKDRKVALTSVAVILDRLHQKGIVDREIEKGRGGGHYIYSTKSSKEEFEETVIDSTVNKLINTFGPTAVNYFNKRFKKAQ